MSDIRRSGRATKGQHRNLEPADAATTTTTTTTTTPKSNNKKGTATPAASNKKSASKKSAEPEPEAEAELEGDDDDDEAAEEIRCVCGDMKDDVVGRSFISCDTCEVWQHNVCMGVTLDEDSQPEHYFCEQCSPQDHKELLDAMARGEKLWETRIEEHEAEKRRKRNERKRPKSRQHKAARQSAAVSDVKSEAPTSEKASPAPASASIAPTLQDSAPAGGANKRKFEEETPHKEEKKKKKKKEEEEEQQPEAQETEQPTTTTTSSPVTATQSKRRKSEQQKKDDKVDPDTAIVELEQLPKDRQGVAQALVKVFGDVVRERVGSGSYSLGQGENAESVSRLHATRIEYECFQVYGVPSSPGYRAQFNAIRANLKQNPMLVQRMLDGSLTANGLATMSTHDMASEELQKQRQQLKEEADKQALMMRDDDDKPRVRRTHKGDEYIDDNTATAHESVFTSAPVRARDDQEKPPTPDADASAVAGADASTDAMDIDRRESNFDINQVWAQTPADQQAQPIRRRSSFAKTHTPQEKGEKHDADVDRMLADDDNDEADYAPPEANGVVWKGQLIQPGVTEFTACARHAAGNNFGQFMPWTELLPSVLEIEGRLDAKRADDYLCGLQWSKKSDVSVLALTPYNDRGPFDQIFDYFASRKRYAVVSKARGMSQIVKDVYITPIGPNHPLPPHINLLEYSNLDPAVPERMLVVTFVVNKPDHWDNPIVSEAPQPVGASPVNGISQGPQFSPRPPQGFTPMQNGNGHQQFGALPPNPYATAQAPAQPQAYPGATVSVAPYPSPAQPPPSYAPHPNPMVHNVLGALAHAPVVGQILSAAGNHVEEHVLLNMRDILTSDPAARDDLGIFSQRLANMGQQTQQQG